MNQAANTTVYREPNTRSASVEWTPDLIRQAELQAGIGNLRLASDLCDFCFTDAKVLGDLDIRSGTLLGLPFSFEPGEGPRKNRAIRALEAGEDWWLAFPEAQQIELLRWGALLGIGLAQSAWELDERSGRVVPHLKVWNPRNLRQLGDGTWLLTVADGDFGTKEITITPGDGVWWLYTPKGGSQPWMRGAWRAISRWALLKRYALADWGNYSGRKGSGIFLGIPPEGAKPEHRKALAEDLADMGRDAAVVPPPGYDVKLIESVANTSQTFEKQTDTADRQIGYGLLGHNQTSEQGGSFAKAQSLNGVRVQVLASDAAGYATAIHDGALVFWAEFNFGTALVAPWPTWDSSPPEDLEAGATAMSSMAKAVEDMRAQGINVDVAALAAKYNVPVADDEQGRSKGALYEYHFKYGILTVNEARERLGLEPVKDGDVPATAPTAPTAVDPNADPKDDPNEGDEPAPPNGKPPKLPKKAHAIAQRAPARTGFLNGQLYADAVADDARDSAAKVFRGDLKELLDVIEGALNYDELRTKLVAFYVDLDGSKLAKLTEKAIVLAQLGGRLGVLEDL